MTQKTVKVDWLAWARLTKSIKAMQGKVIYMEDEEGVLRRWYPPSVPKEVK